MSQLKELEEENRRLRKMCPLPLKFPAHARTSVPARAGYALAARFLKRVMVLKIKGRALTRKRVSHQLDRLHCKKEIPCQGRHSAERDNH